MGFARLARDQGPDAIALLGKLWKDLDEEGLRRSLWQASNGVGAELIRLAPNTGNQVEPGYPSGWNMPVNYVANWIGLLG